MDYIKNYGIYKQVVLLNDVMPNFLGVRIDNLSINEAIVRASNFLYNNKQNIIFTPNPEMLVDANRDDYFKEVLNKSNLNLCDGFGITLMSFGKIHRITGVDFVYSLCELAQKENKSIFLLGSENKKILEKTAEKLTSIFPKLRISGFNTGPIINYLVVEGKRMIFPEEERNEQAIHEIIMSAPDILLVAFGHNKQEKWICENLINLPSVKIAMGVGGTFDYISGSVSRAPCFLRKIGLEWLYRLLKQPWRIKRIFKATIIFVYIYISKRLNKVL